MHRKLILFFFNVNYKLVSLQKSIVLITQCRTLSIYFFGILSITVFINFSLCRRRTLDTHITIESDSSVQKRHSSADTDLGTPGFSATMDQPSEADSEMTDCLKQASKGWRYLSQILMASKLLFSPDYFWLF